MERAKYQQGEWTILTITDNGITIPARYKTKDWGKQGGTISMVVMF